MNDRQKRFCEFYAENPDGTDAAIKAGYSPRTAASIGSENLRKPELLEYIRKLQDQAAAGRVASILTAKAFLSDVLRNQGEKTADRIRAAELLMKSSGAFVRIREDDGGRMIEAGADDGKTIIILPPRDVLPPLDGEEDDLWPRDEEIPEGWTVIG